MSAQLVGALQALAARAAARLGLALALGFAVTVLPTVVHSLWTGGPVEAIGDLVIVTRWILADLNPLPDLSSFTVIGSI